MKKRSLKIGITATAILLLLLGVLAYSQSVVGNTHQSKESKRAERLMEVID